MHAIFLEYPCKIHLPVVEVNDSFSTLFCAPGIRHTAELCPGDNQDTFIWPCVFFKMLHDQKAFMV